MNTVSNLLTPAKAIQAEQEAEAEQTVKSDFIYDIAGVLDAATPSSAERSSRAKDYAAIFCTRLESLIDNARRSDDAGTGIGAKSGRESKPLVAEAARKRTKATGKMLLTATIAESVGEQVGTATYSQAD
ncbi:hypothetical protein GGH96_003287, partial [Coemansia sp. RSA 1972]